MTQPASGRAWNRISIAGLAAPVRRRFVHRRISVSTLAGVLDGNAANAAILVDVDEGGFVEVARLGDLGDAKLNVQRVGVLEVLNPHGVKERSKNAL